MTRSSQSASLGEIVQDILGVALDDLQFLSEQKLIDALSLISYHVGPQHALVLLESIHEGDKTLLLSDVQVGLLIDAGEFSEAVALAQRRCSEEDSLVAQGNVARALLNANLPDQAATIAAALLDVAPEDETALYINGLTSLAHRDFAMAERHFQQALVLYKDSVLALRGLARIAFLQGDVARALDLAGRALASSPAFAPELLREIHAYLDRLMKVDPKDEIAQRRRRRLDELVAARTAILRADVTRDVAHRRDARLIQDSPQSSLKGQEGMTILPLISPPNAAVYDSLLADLRDNFGHTAFRAGQAEAIASVMGGIDLLAALPAGTGKALCYQLPALLREGVTLVISPHTALMTELLDSLPQALLPWATSFDTQLESAEHDLRLSEISSGRYRLVYAAPERLRQQPFIHALTRAGVTLIVVDEAHSLSMWGHNFLPDYLFIPSILHELGDPQVLAITTIATREMMAEIATLLRRELSLVTTGALRRNLFLAVREVEEERDKMRLLLPLLQHQRRSGIVYVHGSEQAGKVEQQLRAHGINARAYHEELGLAERTALRDRFLSGEIRVMVATDAFRMSMAKRDVRFIVHYTPPPSLELYAQDLGLAGRDGKPARCVLLHSADDRAQLVDWSREEAVDINGLRSVYRCLRALLKGGAGLVDATSLRERLSVEGQGTVDLHVAIAILQKADLLYRGQDIPRGATVTIRGLEANEMVRSNEGQWQDFLQLAYEKHPTGMARPLPLDMVTVARELDLTVTTLENRLLCWQDEERLVYRGVGRDMWIELPAPPDDSAARMSAILDRMGRHNRERLDTLFSYLMTAGCRHNFLAHYFGNSADAPCRRCDVCRPVHVE